MQTRQNKRIRTKRIYRDRTVTTLTGNDRDQDPFLIAGHDEQHTFNPHPPFVAGPANFNQNPMMPPNFGFGFNSFVGPMNSNNNSLNEPQQPYFPQQQPILPPGQNDLEILENLKERIKRGQHEFFRVAPTPAALESLYLGPLAALEEEKVQALPEATSKRESSTPVASESSSKNSVQEPAKENGTGSKSTVEIPSLPAKPAAVNKDNERPLGRETYPPPSPLVAAPTAPASSYDRERDRRGSGAEYASIRYGPVADRRLPPDTRHYDASYLDEHRRLPPRPDDRDRDRLPSLPPLPPPSDRDRFPRPIDERYRSEERVYDRVPPRVDDRDRDRDRDRLPPRIEERLPPPRVDDRLPPPSGSSYRPDDRHEAVTPVTVPVVRHTSRYNENRPQIGESPVAAAAAAERERQAALVAAGLAPPSSRSRLVPPPVSRPVVADDRDRLDRERDNSRDRDRERRPPSSVSVVPGSGPPLQPSVKLEERISARPPTLQERLSSHPAPATGNPNLNGQARTLSLEERLSSHPSKPTTDGTVTPAVASGGAGVAQAVPTGPARINSNVTGTTSAPTTSSPGIPPPPGSASSTTTSSSTSTAAPPPSSASSVASSATTSASTTDDLRRSSVTVTTGVAPIGTATRPAYDERDRDRERERDSRLSHSRDPDMDHPPPGSSLYPPPAASSYRNSAAPDYTSNRRYASPTPSERDRDRRRPYSSPPPSGALLPPSASSTTVYDERDRERDRERERERDRERDRDLRRAGPPPPAPVGRDYVYDERDRERERERDRERDRDRDRRYPEDDPYYRPSSSAVVASRAPPPPSVYPLTPGPSVSDRERDRDRYERDRDRDRVPLATSMASSRSAAWEARGGGSGSVIGDHERRTSSSGGVLIPHSPVTYPGPNSISTATPPRGSGGGIPIPPSAVAAAADPRYRTDRDPRYSHPPSATAASPPAYSNHSRVRPRSPSPRRIDERDRDRDRDRDRPPIKRARDDLYPPPGSNSGSSYLPPYSSSSGSSSAPSAPRRVDYPPPSHSHHPHSQHSIAMTQVVRDRDHPRDPYYDPRQGPPPGADYRSGGGSGRDYPPPPGPGPSSYDRPRSPARVPGGGGSSYAGGGYRGDPRDVRDVRDSRDVRDVRDVRDIRGDPRDDRRYSMPPPPLPR